MRTLSAIVIVIALVAAVSIAYVQCGGGSGCGSASSASSGCASCAGSGEQTSFCGSNSSCAAKANCDGDCDTCTCKKAKNCDGDCATCTCKKASAKRAKASGADACVKVEGTVRYVRSTKKAVKLMNGDKGYLLRVGGDCGGCQKTMISTISDLEKGDAIVASYKTCPTSGRYYICSLTSGGTAVGSAATAPAPKAESTSEGTSG